MTHEERNKLHLELMQKHLQEKLAEKYGNSEYFDTMLEQIQSYQEKYEEKDFIPLTTFL